ncbi:CHAT domain-containing protein [Streptomyces sp. NPDC019224]|uniref:CHAT domain-containing protein n=1 Tax=Streptomyces sp. NPDC019224 TaxID=3154484 RepID=UPI003409C44F
MTQDLRERAGNAARLLLRQAARAGTDARAGEWFLGPEAAAAAQEVRAAVVLPDGGLWDLAALALGHAEWFRYLSMREADPTALGAAVLWCASADVPDPERLPRELRPLLALLADAPDGAATDPGLAYHTAIGLMTLFQRGLAPGGALSFAETLLRHAATAFGDDSLEQGTCLSDLGLVLLYAFETGAGRQALAAAVEASRATVLCAFGDRDEQARRHGNLGHVLRHWAGSNQDPEAMREAVAALRRAVELTTWDNPVRPQLDATLGSALCGAAGLLADPGLRREGVALLRAALAETGVPLPSRASFLSDLGVALVQGAPDDGDDTGRYEEGIAACRQAAETAPNPYERVVYLTNLALLLSGHAVHTGDRHALDAADEVAREALDAAPEGHSIRAQAHYVLSRVLGSRYAAGGRTREVEEALAHALRGMESVPPDDLTRRVLHATGLAELLSKQALRRVGTTGAADSTTGPREAVALIRALAADLPARSEDRARILLALGRCLRASADPADLDEAVDCFRACLALPPPDDTFEATARFALGTALTHRAGTDDDAWRRGAEEMRRALGLFPERSPAYWECHADYAHTLFARNHTTSGVELYEEAVRLMREELAHAPFSRPRSSVCRSNIGVAQARIAGRTGRPELFAESVATHREAMALSSADDFLHAYQCMCFGEALLALGEFCSDTGAMREGIEVLRGAVAASDEDTYGGATCRTALGEALRHLARLSSDPAPLEESVRLHREALVMTSGPPDPGARLALANSLGALHRYTRDAAQADEALFQYRAALRALRPETSELRGPLLTGMGFIQWSTARHTGDEQLMDSAVETLREAVHCTPRARVGMALTDLGSALMDRGRLSGNRVWVAEAVAVLRRALKECLPSSMDRPLHMNNLAEALRQWDALTGGSSATEEAAGLLRAAMAVEGGDHAGGEVATLNLAALLIHQAEENGDPRAVDEARRILEEAVDRFGAPHPLRFSALQKLALAHQVTAQLSAGSSPAARQAWERAAAAARESLVGMAEDDPDHTLSQTLLVVSQLNRHDLGEPVDLAEVVRRARVGARNPAAHRVGRVQAAHVWGLAAARAGDHAEALEGYAYAVGLLPGIAPRGLARVDQEARLSNGDGLACDAAALAIEAGRPDYALALLEQGRGVLLGQGLEDRADVSRLREADPARAAEFERVRDELSAPSPLSPAHDAHRAGEIAEARHALAARWSRLLAEVRELPGLDGFLRPPAVPELVAAADGGPVVVVNVSAHRCDALVVTAGAGIEVVPLPGLTLSDAVERAAEFVDGVETAYGGNGVDRAVAMMGTLSATLGWLWDTIAAPVLAHLGLDAGPAAGEPWPRLWWCPTGWLSFLPLHAAGRGGPDSGTWVMDRAVSSYTPTLRALARARAGLAAGARGGRGAPPAPLVVALAETPGAPPLPGVTREAEVLAELFPGRRLMAGADATVDAVGRALEAHPWVHFSCHGVSELLSPSQSGLVLYDGRLTVSDVAGRRPANPELAVLSACSASRGGVELSDEAVQLAAAFQLAGYPHVIGTLWPIADKLATHLTEAFYRALAEDIARGRPIDPAAALHGPVRALRDRYARAPHLWAAHLHTGP